MTNTVKMLTCVCICFVWLAGWSQVSLAEVKSTNIRVGIRIVQPGQIVRKQASREIRLHTTGSAALNLRKLGYNDIHLHSKDANYYWFLATNDGVPYRVMVSKKMGEVIKTEILSFY
jgi:hypothetical protein